MVVEYMISCPECQTVTKLVCEEANPVIFACHGCDKNVVMHNDRIFTISDDFLADIMIEYKSVSCGRILGANLSRQSQEKINNFKMRYLKNILKEDMDVSEFIKRI